MPEFIHILHLILGDNNTNGNDNLDKIGGDKIIMIKYNNNNNNNNDNND